MALVPLWDILPRDVQIGIFILIGDISRAKVCSVSSAWYDMAIEVSRQLSPVPYLYNKTPFNYELSSNTQEIICNDYHILVRLKPAIFSAYNKFCRTGRIELINLHARINPFTTRDPGEMLVHENLFDVAIKNISTLKLHHFRNICQSGNINNIRRYLLKFTPCGVRKLDIDTLNQGLIGAYYGHHLHVVEYLFGHCGDSCILCIIIDNYNTKMIIRDDNLHILEYIIINHPQTGKKLWGSTCAFG